MKYAPLFFFTTSGFFFFGSALLQVKLWINGTKMWARVRKKCLPLAASFSVFFMSLCTPIQYPIHPLSRTHTLPSVWQAKSYPALGFLNGLTPCATRDQGPHFINLSLHGNSFPAWQPLPPGSERVCGTVREGRLCSGAVINSACDQTSRKHIKMPLILAALFQGPLQINQRPVPAGLLAASVGEKWCER